MSRSKIVATVGLGAVSLSALSLWMYERSSAQVSIAAVVSDVQTSLAKFESRQRTESVIGADLRAQDGRGQEAGDSKAGDIASSIQGVQYVPESEGAFSTTPGISAALSSLKLPTGADLVLQHKELILKQLPYKLSDEEFAKLFQKSRSIVEGIIRVDLGLDLSKLSEDRLSEIAGAIAIIYKQAEFLHVAQTNLPNISGLSSIPEWALPMLEEKARARSWSDKAIFGSTLQSNLIGIVQTLTEQQIPLSEWANFGIFPR